MGIRFKKENVSTQGDLTSNFPQAQFSTRLRLSTFRRELSQIVKLSATNYCFITDNT